MTEKITFETLDKIKPGLKPPPSCVGWMDTFFGSVLFLVVFFRLKDIVTITSTELAFYMILGTASILGYLEISRAPWLKTKPSSETFTVIAKRAAIKWLGFWLCIGAGALLYWLLPEYKRPYYQTFFDLARMCLPWMPALFAAYFLYAEWRFPEERDGSWQVGMLAMGQFHAIDKKVFFQHILGWMVKFYFIPIMFGDMANGINKLRVMDWDILALPLLKLYALVLLAATTFELVFVCAGYLFSARLFNSQIRATEATFFGWFIALMSYGPFNTIFYNRYLNYRPNGDWQTWLAGHETLIIIWASIMMVLLVLHFWCDACFGLRFSNLTNRGIITNGMYRFSKHPAYVIKGTRWAMMYVPFLMGGSWDENLRLSLLFLGVNLVYYLRARTEEKLLSQDPVYIEYGLWMDKHGLFSWVGRLIPHAKYENRLRAWVERGELVRLQNPVKKMDV